MAVNKLKANFFSEIGEVNQKINSLQEEFHQMKDQFLVIQQLLGKYDVLKLDKIDQIEKNFNALKNKMNQCKNVQEEAKLPEPQE